MQNNGMNFEELDRTTRDYMLAEFDAEENGGHPYRSNKLSSVGTTMFPGLMRVAIESGNEQTLIDSLRDPNFWLARYPTSNGFRRVNFIADTEQLGLTEFNTWYVRGFAARLLAEGETECQVYRAMLPRGSANPECSNHEGRIYPVQLIYSNHRRRYWSDPIDRQAFCIPIGPSCHHTIRRIKSK
jgi:hypothetical protein